MSSIKKRLRHLFLFVSCLCLSVNALPNGSVGCEGGEAAVSGLHTQQGTVLTGPLSQDDIEFQVNGVALQPGVPFNIDIGADNHWRLITAGTFFRGYLVRLGRGTGNVDTRLSLDTDSSTGKVAQTACLDAYWVGGVTHNSNVLKNVEEGTLFVHLPSQNMPLDVTVVIQNRNGYSIYYYSPFIIHANPPGSRPTAVFNETVGKTPTFTPYFPPPTAMPTDTPAPVTMAPSMDPTESPTVTPTTGAPTAAPSVPEYMFLRFPTCSLEAPCRECQGDCDTNDECAGPLECFHRPQDDISPVPGCAGDGVAGRDYCYAALPNSLRPRMPECTTDNPCDACYGDCDNDSECAGDLRCFIRGQGELTPIFGCSGLGIAGLDYCYNATAAFAGAVADSFGDRFDTANSTGVPLINTTVSVNASDAQVAVPAPLPAVSPVPVPVAPSSGPPTATSPTTIENEDFSSNDQSALTDVGCTETEPCTRCEGDCQADNSLCVGFLECFVRPANDMSGVLGCQGAGTAGTDYCWTPIANTLVIRTRPCTADMPCDVCQGGCSDDSQCAGFLRCFRRQDLSVVPGCGNGFFGVNFCWDPNAYETNGGGRHNLLRH